MDEEMSRKMATKEFIQRAQEVHGNKYDYSRVQYENSYTKVEIVCPQHGSFYQKPSIHLRESGCPECGNLKRMSKMKLDLKSFVQKANGVHGRKYSYENVQYVNSKMKVEIICPEHGSFHQTPNSHLSGQGCPECAGNRKTKKEEFIQKANQVHGDKYDYEQVDYINSKRKVEIVCPQHGSFWQIPNNHLRGHGCPKCAGEKTGKDCKMSLDAFIQKAREVHRDEYDYSKVQYKNAHTKVEIVCPSHGSFYQTPNSHLKGGGCPKCGNRISKGEQELADVLKTMGLGVIQSYRKWCPERPKLEIDIYLPEYSIGIEYNGEYWHQEPDREKEKKRLALQQGIQIITVWESEWKKDKEGVLEKALECLKD